MKLYPNCSESISRIGIDEEELPYIKKRLKDLGNEDLLNEFTDMLGKRDEDDSGNMVSEGEAIIYDTIRDEILAKRDCKICPFCKVTPIGITHLKELHKEEIKNVLRYIDMEEYKKLRKEIIANNI